MTEYIKRILAKAEFTGNFQNEYPVGQIHALIDCVPAADVRENVKGEWLYVVEEIEGTTFRGCRCSKCNYWKGMGIFNFCPNCGAEMKGKTDG